MYTHGADTHGISFVLRAASHAGRIASRTNSSRLQLGRGVARDSRSPPPARAANQSAIVLKSRSRSPVTAKYAGLGDKSSAVVDARELINRKRAALVSANEHKEEKAKRHQQQLMSAAARKHELVVDVDDELAGGKQRSAISRLKPSTERLKGTRERLKENVNAAMAAAAAGNSRAPAAEAVSYTHLTLPTIYSV